MTNKEIELLKKANDTAIQNIKDNGGPFGAVAVDESGSKQVVGCNRVTDQLDPTAHAEVQAIRNHEQKYGVGSLQNGEIFTSCYPCPMCNALMEEKGISRSTYSSSKKDADNAGFADDFLYVQQTLLEEEKEPSVPVSLLPDDIRASVNADHFYLLDEAHRVIASCESDRLFTAIPKLTKQINTFETPNCFLVSSKELKILDYMASCWMGIEKIYVLQKEHLKIKKNIHKVEHVYVNVENEGSPFQLWGNHSDRKEYGLKPNV
ncbi:tRNA(Arg) A34 adenosine deaminase TadA [Thermoactinomyces sp. DSM 45891]|uniref:deaminase n=1 Tax=Thermoactinomyces sp. DSM 45891 TaxID=1761907 RepID=UPI0009202BA0|nr:nucleoside deaminase [Thermoactinomyces sp. DSM 45891]SFX19070.1 tRNA(Arg) A34 adenosine deaminase TadA [Thermoactinomyces sp. DSM 45891]